MTGLFFKDSTLVQPSSSPVPLIVFTKPTPASGIVSAYELRSWLSVSHCPVERLRVQGNTPVLSQWPQQEASSCRRLEMTNLSKPGSNGLTLYLCKELACWMQEEG